MEHLRQKQCLKKQKVKPDLQKLLAVQWDSQRYVSTDYIAKQNIDVLILGHVDSGKSTLLGCIRQSIEQKVDIGISIKKNIEENGEFESDKTMEKCCKTILNETKSANQYCLELQKKRIAFSGTPGNKNLHSYVLKQVCTTDVVFLTISAQYHQFESGFEKYGQTREHALLAKVLGASELVVIVTKMNLIDWKEERFKYIQQKVENFVKAQCGISKVAFIPVDSVAQQNIYKKKEVQWYKGVSLFQYMDNINISERQANMPLRIPVLNTYKQENEWYIQGKIQSGIVEEGQTVTIIPCRNKIKIEQIWNIFFKRLPFAYAGQNVLLQVKNLDQKQINRGNIICNNFSFCWEVLQIKVHLTITSLPQHKAILHAGYNCMLNIHVCEEQAEISSVLAKEDEKMEKKIKAFYLKKGDRGICTIKLKKPVCVQKFDFLPRMGRFSLRDQGQMIAFGQIIGVKPLNLSEDVHLKTENKPQIYDKYSENRQNDD